MTAEKCFQCNKPLRDAGNRVIVNPAIREHDGVIARFHYDCAEQYDLQQRRRASLTGIPDANRATP
jgi:hypothetical protein